jgi:hypothetical protein
MANLLMDLLKSVVKVVLSAKLQELADKVDPAYIEKQINLDEWIGKLESNPKYAELQPLLADIQAKGATAEHQLAVLIDAIVDLLPVIALQLKL